MAKNTTARIFGAIADLCLRRPGTVLLVALLLCVGAGVLASGLRVSTSRTGLVSDDQPEQAKLRRFQERFGRPESPLVLVAGGTPEQRRAIVDRLSEAYEQEPEFAGRVLGRITPKTIAEVLLLQRADAMAQLRAALPPGVELAPLVEGGAVAWMAAIADRLEGAIDGAAAADGEDGQGAAAAAAAVPIDRAAEGLAGLGSLATALDDYIAGKNAMDRFVGAGTTVMRRGVDELGYLVTGNGDAHMVALYPELVSDEGAAVEPMVRRIREIRDVVLADAPAGVTADVTGLPAIIVDELHVVQQGLQLSTVVSSLAIIGLCWLLFRSLFQTILANLPLLPGVVLTLGVVQVVYGHLNLITSSFVAVLLGLGIDFAVHMLSRFNEAMRAGVDRPTAVRQALIATGPGIFAGAAITAVGFLAGVTTEFTAYGELGVITAVGLLMVMTATFTVLPSLLARALSRVGRAVAPEPPGLSRLPALVRRARWPLAVIGVGTGLVGALLMPRVEFNPRYFDFLPAEAESGRALVQLEYDPIASPVFANLSAPDFEEARAMTQTLRGLDTVAGVQSATDLVPPLDPASKAALAAGFAGIGRDPDFARLATATTDAAALQREVDRVIDALDEVRFAMAQVGVDGQAAVTSKAAFEGLRTRLRGLDDAERERLRVIGARVAEVLAPAWTTARRVAQRQSVLPSDLPPLFARRFASKDGQALALFVVPAGRFWEREVAEAFAADIRTVDSEASGLALDHVAHGTMILAGFKRAAVIAAVGIFAILLLDFRSVRDAILALLPTLVGWGWMIAVMVALGWTFDVANIVSLPLVLGIGIAYGVHLMHRVREGDPRPDSSMPNVRPRLDDAVVGTGGAIAVAALTTAAGFSALMVQQYGGMLSLGRVMVLGIGTCLVATLLVLPAALLLSRRAE
ncbi:MAG: MMPL family transporter [Deltaproteobacteria bacterium]|nr:MMPL family transporter [Deltaproteobacteria bacterium]MBK8237711.1 MMPL family transporter [Deltaproteobacteria bacterium]MBP7292035.1 MMPL family transporter [Nannocystaceae bacterium]